MAVSAAEFYEVRWRVKGNDEAWSTPRRVSPVSEVVIDELDRNTQYEFEVRAVSNCGAKSVWVPSDYTVPGAVPPTSVDTLTAQSLADGVHLGWTSIAIPAAGIESSIERSANGTTGWAERARVRSTAYTDPETSGATHYYRVRYVNFAGQFGAYSPVVSSNGVNVGGIGTNASNALADAAAAQADADAANAALADIASDGILSPVEKPVVIRDTNVITTEQPGIDAQATAYSITTQKTAYDTAVSALTVYLATLTTPVLWSNLTGNTTIVGATFRSKFADVYTTRQTLLNAIYAAAKAKADTAKASADAAQDTANTAVGQVTQLPVINGGFDMLPTGYGWNADPGSGWTIDTAGNTPGIGPNSAKHVGGSGGIQVFRNAGLSACQPGQVYKAQGLIKAVGANGSCYVAISWCNAAGGEITTTPGNLVTGTTTAGSYAVDAAPAGTVYARTILVTNGHTAGTYYVDNVVCSQYPSSLDEVPDGSTKFGAVFDPTTQGGIAQPGQNLMPNSTGALGFSGLPGFGWIGGTQQQMTTRAGLFGAAGPMFSCAFPGTGAVDQGFNVTIPQAASGVPVTVSADMDALVVATGSVFIELRFLNASGTEINAGNRPRITATNGMAMKRYSTTATTESGTASITAVVRFTGTMGSNSAVAWRNIKLEIGAVATPYNDAASQFGNQLTVPGSNYRIGDQRNLTAVTFGNYGSGWSGLSLSYTSTTTSATISASAATLQAGGASAAYSASSVTLSGSAGSVVTYYLYYVDPGMAGGAKTLQATTNQITSLSNDGNVLLGTCKVTYPTSGTGGGGGSSSCPDENAWVLRADPEGVFADTQVQAKTIRAGHYLRLTDGRVGRVTYSQRKPAYRVRVIDENGESLTCSDSAPLELASTAGECVLAPDAAGRRVKVRADGAEFGALVWRVEDAGDGYVQHITCQNACFWTGDDPAYLFGHHNLKPQGP